MTAFKACLDTGKVVLFSPPRLTVGENALVFRRILLSLIEEDFKDIIFDASSCTYIDSMGIGEIVAALTTLSREGGSFSLNNLTQRLEDLFSITRLLSMFNVYKTDYSDYTLVDVSPDDISALTKAVSLAGLDTLNLLMSLSNGRIKVLPSQQEGIYRLSLSGDSSGELILAAPHVIANVTRSYIRDEIEEFESIINSPISTEHDIQKFLEEHPKFLLGHEYQKLYPQVILEREEQGTLIPDFLVQPVGKEFCDIVDLKLPGAPLIVGKDDRKRFSSAIAEAAAQLRTYRDYFDDKGRREAVKKRYGVTAYRPKLAVIVGRASDIDATLYRQIQDGLQNVQVITYDELIQKAKNFLLL